MTAFYSDQIEEFNLAFSSVVLHGNDWKLCINHEIGPVYSESYPSVIALKVAARTKKRKFERTVFELGYSDFSFEEAMFANNDYSTINSNYIAGLTKEGLKKKLLSTYCELAPLSEYNSIITCQAIPVEVRQWLLMNGIAEIAPELKKVRIQLKKKIKEMLKT